MSIYSSFKPTYLYIKQHTITGKLYFGKMTSNRHTTPETYLGSGTYWKRHIKKHGTSHVVTLWYCLFLEQASCTEFAILFSKQQNITKSLDWLNLREENGLDGQPAGHKIQENLTNYTVISRSIQAHGDRYDYSKTNYIDDNTKILITCKIHGDFLQNPREHYTGHNCKKCSLEPISCPHCNKSGSISNMKRWHFDNCKFK